MIGQLDTELSEKGLRQAKLVALRLQYEKFTHAFASDLKRAKKVSYISHIFIGLKGAPLYMFWELCSSAEFYVNIDLVMGAERHLSVHASINLSINL